MEKNRQVGNIAFICNILEIKEDATNTLIKQIV